jgi:hypothetical protein
MHHPLNPNPISIQPDTQLKDVLKKKKKKNFQAKLQPPHPPTTKNSNRQNIYQKCASRPAPKLAASRLFLAGLMEWLKSSGLNPFSLYNFQAKNNHN